MVKPFIFVFVDVKLRAKWTPVEFLLGALVNDRAGIARKWGAVLFAFEEVLA